MGGKLKGLPTGAAPLAIRPASVPCRLGGRTLEAVVDSGAIFSCVRKTYLDQHVKNWRSKIVPCPELKKALQSASGHPLWIHALVAMGPISLGGHTTAPVRMFVMEELSVPLLLGANFLQDHKACLDYSSMSLAWQPWLRSRKHRCQVRFQIVGSSDASVDHVGLAGAHEPDQTDRQKVHDDLNKLDLTHLPALQQKDLRAFLKDKWRVFAPDPDAPTATTEIQLRIPTGDAKPVWSRVRYMNPQKQAILEKAVASWLKGDKIVRSTSPWNSCPLIIPKPGGGWRVCIDYRRVNQVTVPEDARPILVDELFEQLDGCTLFSSLDLANAYLQLPIDPRDQAKTAFSTASGRYEFKCGPFGLRNLPAQFNTYFSSVLQRVPGRKPPNYFDDVAAGTKGGLAAHLKYLGEIFDVLIGAHLQLKLQKCKFVQKRIQFCGFDVSGTGIQPRQDGDKVKALKARPAPTSVKETRSLLGAVGFFRRFIPKLTKLQAPIQELVSGTKRKVFKWTPECQQAFEGMKKALAEAPLLSFADWTRLDDFPIRVTADASMTGLGAVLEQAYRRDAKGKLEFRPLAFASRVLVGSEKAYPPIEKEGLALFWAVRLWEEYLRAAKFIVRTDHKPLVHMFQKREPNSRVNNWLLALGEFAFDLQFVQGVDNGVADWLSRSFETLRGQSAAAAADSHSRLLDAMGDSFGDLPTGVDNTSNLVAVSTRLSRLSKTERNDRAIAQALANQSDDAEEEFSPRALEFEGVEDEDWGPNQEGSRSSAVLPTASLRPRVKARPAGAVVQQPKAVIPSLLKTPTQWIEAQDTDTRLAVLRLMIQGRPVSEEHRSTPSDRWAQRMFAVAKSNKSGFSLRDDGVLVRHSARGVQIVVPQPLIQSLLEEFHNSPAAGHQGADRTLGRLQRHFWFPNMARTVETFCSACPTCAMVNVNPRGPPSARSTVVLKETQRPAEEWHLDFIGPFPKGVGHNFQYVLVAIDAFSGWVEVFPVPSMAVRWISSALNQLSGMWGLPRRVRTDNGPGFNNDVFAKELERLGIERRLIPPQHPEANSKVERVNRVLKDTTRRLLASCTKAGTDWYDVVFQVKFACNSAVSKSNDGYAPWQLQVGWNPLFPSERNTVAESTEPRDEAEWIASQAASKLDAHRQRKVEMAYKQGVLAELNASTGPNAEYEPTQAVWVRCSDPKTLAAEMVSSGNPDKPAQRRWVRGVILEKMRSLDRTAGPSKTYKVNCVDETDGSRRKVVIATTEQLKKRVVFPKEMKAAVPKSESRREEARRSYRDVVAAGIGT